MGALSGTYRWLVSMRGREVGQVEELDETALPTLEGWLAAGVLELVTGEPAAKEAKRGRHKDSQAP